jgi:hypothetical protein
MPQEIPRARAMLWHDHWLGGPQVAGSHPFPGAEIRPIPEARTP